MRHSKAKHETERQCLPEKVTILWQQSKYIHGNVKSTTDSVMLDVLWRVGVGVGHSP